MGWSMTVIQSTQTRVVVLGEDEVAVVEGSRAQGAREVVFGKRGELGLWRAVEARTFLDALKQLEGVVDGRVKKELRMLGRFVKKSGGDVWVGVG